MTAEAVEPLLQQAIALHRQGALAEAARLYAQVLQTAPANIDALFHSARMHCQQGRFEQGIAFARRALASDPKQARVHNLIGGALYRMGRREEALLSFESAVSAQPDFADAHENRGNLLSELRRFEGAVESYDRAVALRPDSASAWSNRGVAFHELGRYAEALASFDRALALKPDSAELHGNRASALMALDRNDEALASYRMALAKAPAHVETLNNCGVLLNKLDRYQEALVNFDAALKLKPDLADALNNSGNALRGLYRYEEAVERYRRALALQPDFAEAMMNLGNALQALNRYEDALSCYDKATAIKPEYPEAKMNYAGALQALGRFDDAIAHYDQAIALQPNHAPANWNKALLCLSLGRFAEGWDLFEHRWAGGKGLEPRPYKQPRWNGQKLDGTLLVWSEQGLGDEILLSSMIPELVSYADKIVLEVEPRLVALCARSFPNVEVIGLRQELYAGPVDAQIALGSLGKYFRPDWSSFPRQPTGHLKPDPARTQALRERLDDGRTLIGLSWISRAPGLGKSKSATLRDLGSLLRLPQCRFIDLQYGDTRAEREAIEREFGVRVERLPDIDTTNDLDGLAALIGACDFVVSVSNVTAQLAGAVGKPTRVMVPHGHARLWFWFYGKERSPWYCDVHVKHQRSSQPWSELAEAIASEISADRQVPEPVAVSPATDRSRAKEE